MVRYATDEGRFPKSLAKHGEGQGRVPTKVEGYANDLLLLIADKRFCRVIVDSSPGTALAIFCAMEERRKYGIPVEIFAKNIMNEAIANKNSFLFHEADGYHSGLLGYHKPLSQAMFSNYQMVETLGTLFDPDTKCWDAVQWEAYCRAVLMTVRSYVKEGSGCYSRVLSSATEHIGRAVIDLYALNKHTCSWDSDEFQRLRVVVKFITEVVKIFDENGVPKYVRLRVRENHGHPRESLYDCIASLIFEVIYCASAVRAPQRECWWIQHNSVWSELFNFGHLDSPAGRIVKFKVRRLLFDEIIKMRRFPNFKGARILGFCLNVMGIKIGQNKCDKDSRALQLAALAWTKKNFVWLYEYNPRVAEACLVDGLIYDSDNRRLVRTLPIQGLRRELNCEYLELDPAQVEPKTAANID